MHFNFRLCKGLVRALVEHSQSALRSVCTIMIMVLVTFPPLQDQFANAFLHDPNMTFPVTLHRAVSVKRKYT